MSRFYQPSSVLSVGLGSQPTQPSTFESQQGKDLKSRFAQEGWEDSKIRFELGGGAIDAQMSVNGGVLLVVTGHIVYERSTAHDHGDDDDDDDQEEGDVLRKAFVHTFFLGSIVSGSKRSYYVHNDVLRFLHDDVEEKTVVASNKTSAAAAAAAAVEEKVVQLPVVEEPPVVVVPTEPPAPVEEPVSPPAAAVVEEEPVVTTTTTVATTTTAVEEIAPGGGVEESKEAFIEEEVVVKTKKEKSAGGKKEKAAAAAAAAKADVKEATTPSKPAKPNSWASLVKSGNGTVPTSTPSTPSRSSAAQVAPSTPKTPKTPASVAAVEKKSDETATATNAKGGDANANPNNNDKNARSKITNKRDPDCTLVIKQFEASTTTEAVIRGLFEPFAGENEAKVIGCTVSGHKALAFVDYDSPKPVLAAVEKHKKEAFQLNGKTLEIYQKTHDYQKPQNRRNQSGRGGAGRGGQSGGGGGGGAAGGGGRPFKRSGSGAGRGERGGGGGRGGRGGR